MKVVKLESSVKKSNSKNCVITDYCFNSPYMDLVMADIEGRYPNIGYCVNENCDEIAFIIDGKVTISYKDNQSFELSKSDAVLISKGEQYFWNGTCKMLITCSPSWYPEQYKIIK